MNKDVQKTNKPGLLKDIAYKQIKELILSEYFVSNQMLSERELIELLNMSKTPIKSALTRLESEGFVKISSKQGIVVLDLSLERILNIYDLRIALESFVCLQLQGSLGEKESNQLLEMTTEMDNAISEKDVEKFTKWDHSFHLKLAEFTGNKEIERVLLNYNDHLRRITFKHLKKDFKRMKDFNKEHIEIVYSLRQEDGNAAELIKEHFKKSKQKLLD